MWAVVALGGILFIITVRHASAELIDLRFLLLGVITLTVGSHVVVRIPRVKGQISVSDTFILLTMLLLDGEAAVLLAAADAFCTSLRITKSKLTILFNTAVYICATFLTAWSLRLLFGSIVGLSQHNFTSIYFEAICVMALVQYVVNSSLVATGVALKAGKPVFQMWRQSFLWSSITYFAGASAAGLVAKLISVFGFYAFLATGPIIAVVYFTYCTYLKNIEVSTSQAELATQHAKQAQRHVAALRESEERFRSAFDYAAIGMAMVSLEGNWIQVNTSLCDIVGYTEQELLAGRFQDITNPDDLIAFNISFMQLIGGELASYETEQRYVHKRGREVWVNLSTSLVRDSHGEPLHLIFQIQDVTDRKLAQEQLLHDAFHDALTGLPNRALFFDHAKMAIQRSKRDETRLFAALFLDFDRFKVINDSLGHMIGDMLLIAIARRLETCLRPGDTVARLGGDEFTILLEDLTDTGDAIEVAQRIQEEISRPFNLSGHDVFTTVSIGIAPSCTGYERADELLRDADTAMYRAKSLGRQRHEVFDKSMHDTAMKLLQLETDLRRAIERNEFVLHYQPIVSLKEGRISGFEALIRWQHPERGFVSPIEFIPLAEETGLIIPIGQWVLAEACRQMNKWQKLVPQDVPLSLSVNLSGKQFMQPDLAEQISRILAETGFDPKYLKLEITESMVMENIDSAIKLLNRIRALGVELSIDDFGTGYSSLSYLHRFPINTLKIDRSFVSQMMDGDENAEIVRTIVTLARSLQMDVVAEGVETMPQLQRLTSLHCDYVQGYLFSEPVSIMAAFDMLSTDGGVFMLAASSAEAACPSRVMAA